MAEAKSEGVKRKVPSAESDVGQQILNEMFRRDANNKPTKSWRITFIAVIAMFSIALVLGTYYFVRTINQMHSTYISKTEDIILGKENVELANSWERMPVQQRKEQLRSQYLKIVRYYTNQVPAEQKMNEDVMVSTFDTLWDTTSRVKQNFFIPIAYMKVMTNFNPIYNSEYKRGLAGFYNKTYESIANLPIVRTDPVFQTVYKGRETAYNPDQSIKLLVARIDDLMSTFNNRIDWVYLALITNEYDVIDKYWDDGKGAIPDKLYKEGKLAKMLMYYHSFTLWEIPKTVDLPKE